MKTKKMPISISYGDFKAKSKEFLIPYTSKEKEGFRGLKSGQASLYGMITFIGKEISSNDIFAKLIDNGQQLDNIDKTLKIFEYYIKELQQFKVGNIISISYSRYDLDFQLVKEADHPPKNKKKSNLP